MTDLCIATTNAGKAREIQAVLAGLPVRPKTLRDFPAWPVFPEEGTTFQENARGKSVHYSQQTDGLVLAEDSGLEVAALGGAPGVYSARFSGEAATDATNIAKVLALMASVPRERRQARFVCCLVLSRQGRVIAEFEGMVEGEISSDVRGERGFGYDPIFYYPPLGKTFGQMSPQEKNSVSHRGRALRKLRDFLTGYLKGG